MMQLSSHITRILDQKSLIQAVFSGPFQRGGATRVSVRPILVKKQLHYQWSEQVEDKIFHRNLGEKESLKAFFTLLPQFKQVLLQTKDEDIQILSHAKGQTTLRKPPSKTQEEWIHNRKKQYLLSDEKPLPFLIELGLMSHQGRLFPHKMDKFRQINRFLEMVADSLEGLSDLNEIQIVDFGCGKAYLTFALYYFLREVKGKNVHVHGLDLKEDVVAFCQQLAEKLGYASLNFSVGDIASYEAEKGVDMVVALHACDQATDYALAKAVQWKAKVILAAPCCQHELYKQVAAEPLEALLHHGILRERFAALVTDAARAALLEACGYSTQILEFIDSQHTPKNLLIRAVRGISKEKQEKAKQRYQKLREGLSIHPTLETLLK